MRDDVLETSVSSSVSDVPVDFFKSDDGFITSTQRNESVVTPPLQAAVV